MRCMCHTKLPHLKRGIPRLGDSPPFIRINYLIFNFLCRQVESWNTWLRLQRRKGIVGLGWVGWPWTRDCGNILHFFFFLIIDFSALSVQPPLQKKFKASPSLFLLRQNSVFAAFNSFWSWISSSSFYFLID